MNLTDMLEMLVVRQGEQWKRVSLNWDGPVVAWADAPRLEQVINNLVENALRYSSPGTPVDLNVCYEGTEARLSVQDHGIGIPVEDQPLVFERFHRAHNVDDRTFAGMGLGLYIARGIVEQHGGRIWLESRAGRGSTFHLALPSTVEAASISKATAQGVST